MEYDLSTLATDLDYIYEVLFDSLYAKGSYDETADRGLIQRVLDLENSPGGPCECAIDDVLSYDESSKSLTMDPGFKFCGSHLIESNSVCLYLGEHEARFEDMAPVDTVPLMSSPYNSNNDGNRVKTVDFVISFIKTENIMSGIDYD